MQTIAKTRLCSFTHIQISAAEILSKITAEKVSEAWKRGVCFRLWKAAVNNNSPPMLSWETWQEEPPESLPPRTASALKPWFTLTENPRHRNTCCFSSSKTSELFVEGNWKLLSLYNTGAQKASPATPRGVLWMGIPYKPTPWKRSISLMHHLQYINVYYNKTLIKKSQVNL